MNREQVLAILELPRSQAEAAIVALWEKAEQWDRLQATSEDTSVSPTTPSGMTPVYLKASSSRRCKKPGRKPGHKGACRLPPERIDVHCAHRLKTCPQCGSAVGKPIREHTRLIEDIPPVTPLVTAHTVHGYWCSHCKTIVAPKVTAALPRSSLGLRFVVYNPVLHADETGWRINGVTFWLWAFATRQYCYYLIDRRRGRQTSTRHAIPRHPYHRLLGRLQRHPNPGQTALLLPPVHRTGKSRQAQCRGHLEALPQKTIALAQGRAAPG